MAVAGRSDLGSTTEAAERLFSENLKWGLDDSIWDLYGARSQPITFVITASGRVADTWFGGIAPASMRAVIDGLLAEA